MEPLPMAQRSCSLDQAGLDVQLARYRAVGRGAEVPSAPHVPALDAILRSLVADPPPAAARPLENPLHTLVIGATPPGHEP